MLNSSLGQIKLGSLKFNLLANRTSTASGDVGHKGTDGQQGSNQLHGFEGNRTTGSSPEGVARLQVGFSHAEILGALLRGYAIYRLPCL
jgi:hypothetical protein